MSQFAPPARGPAPSEINGVKLKEINKINESDYSGFAREFH